MGKKETVTRLVPRIGKPPRAYKLLPWEYELTKSLDNCPIEHSHFIAEYCRLPGQTIELLLRYTKLVNRPIEICAEELGLIFDDSWREPLLDMNNWLAKLPTTAKGLNKEIADEAKLKKPK